MRYGINKVLAAVLALVLCAGLAGCQNAGGNGGNEEAETTAVVAEYTAAPARSLTDVTFNYGSGFYEALTASEAGKAVEGFAVSGTITKMY